MLCCNSHDSEDKSQNLRYLLNGKEQQKYLLLALCVRYSICNLALAVKTLW